MAKAHRGVPRLAHALSAVLLGGVLLLVQVHSADAQTDPYTGGTVTPPASCPTPPHLALTPSQPYHHGQPLTLTTTGITPGGPVSIFMNSELAASGTGDANGSFVTTVVVPPDPTKSFMICATAPPCAMVCLDPVEIVGESAVLGESTDNNSTGTGTGTGGASSVDNRGFARTDGSTGGSSVLGSGFARTGFELLPWLLAALACIAVGRKLERANRHQRRRQKFPRVGPPTIAGYEREDALVP